MKIVQRKVHRCALALSALALFCLGANGAFAAGAKEAVIITSATKQFIVRGLPQTSRLAGSANPEVVYVDPALLAVACETVKRAVAQQLGWGSKWNGTIFINVHPVRGDGDLPSIRSFMTQRGWSYRIEMPDELTRRELFETIVEALVLEFAERNVAQPEFELPPWLVEGLTAHLREGPLANVTLLARPLEDLPMHMLRARVTVQGTNDPLRQIVRQHGALSIDQLNWPEFDRRDLAKSEAYRHSAHLFVREILRLRGGADALTATIAMLPQHLNWQTAFLRGFEPHFRRMLDVEKWWSLAITQLKTHDSSLTWSTAEAQQKLEEILYTPMQVKLRRDEQPHLSPVALQTVINEWTFEQQVALLRAKIVQLQAVRLRLPAHYVAIADAYRAALEKYLRERDGAWFDATARAAARDAVEELNRLDDQRAKATTTVAAAAVAPATGNAAPGEFAP